MARGFEERDFKFVLTETTRGKKRASDVPESHQEYISMASSPEYVNTTSHKGVIHCTWWNFGTAELLHDSPYLLMEVRDMLAEDGMLYDDVCLGTSATTQRSDTCGHRQNTSLLKAY